MPFTFSHPAIILPLTKLPKKYISSTGLIIGSMSPDFEYFINMRMGREHGHTIGGMFYYDLPITLLCCFIFHLMVRDKLIISLPEVLRKRFTQFVGTDWLSWTKKYWYVLVYSSLIGICSHLFWDAFTHSHGFFVEHIPFLQQTSDLFFAEMPNYHLNQILSSLIGLLFILLVVLLPLDEYLSKHKLVPKIIYWFSVVGIQLVVIAARGVENFSDLVATGIAGGLLGIIFAPSVCKLIHKRILKLEHD